MEFLPTLYKKTNTGAIQQWSISVIEDSDHSRTSYLCTTYGQVDGKLQNTLDPIMNGKNIGKKNETSIEEQALVEARSKWEKQLKKGYVQSIEAAKSGELDGLIEGGIVPMLAFTFEKQGHKIKYPCYVQPKLDGIRCIAVVKNGKCTLWSRTRKPITSCPHIVEEIERIHVRQSIILDGELYNNDFKDNFEHIVHLVRQEEPDPQHKDVQYHIYDIVNEYEFENRKVELSSLFTHWKLEDGDINSPLYRVETLAVFNEDQVSEYYNLFKEHGYEGAMIRNSKGMYVNKRSSDLIKVKEMQDAEFEIVGIEEGRGKLSGHVGAFVCLTEDGQKFNVKMSGATEKLKEYFENHDLWKGKQLTVQFQDLTSYGIPRFPVGKTIRNYE